MATLYDKNGKEYNVPNAIDIKEWLKDGYSLENPKEALSSDDLKFNDLIIDIDNLKADDVKFVAKHLSIEYANIEETRAQVIDFLNLDSK